MKCAHSVEMVFSQKKKIITECCHNILYCIADGNYSILFLNDGKSISISKCLKQLEMELPHYCFFRIHRKCLFNLNFFKEFDNNKIRLTNDILLDFATRKNKSDLIVKLKEKLKNEK